MPAVRSSEPRPFSGTIWRVVGAQHQASVMKLVDSVEEQALLERLLEETKPALPRECAGLDPLLSAPFRYGAPDPGGSRFRRAGRTPGVFYGAETVETALAEMVLYRLLFFAESPDTPLPSAPLDFIGFAAAIDTQHCVDLLIEPSLRDDAHALVDKDHAAGQALADAARDAGVEVIRHVSVDVPIIGTHLALLSPKAFATNEPVERELWRIRFSEAGISALCDFPRRRIGFPRSDFSADARLRARFG